MFISNAKKAAAHDANNSQWRRSQFLSFANLSRDVRRVSTETLANLCSLFHWETGLVQAFVRRRETSRVTCLIINRIVCTISRRVASDSSFLCDGVFVQSFGSRHPVSYRACALSADSCYLYVLAQNQNCVCVFDASSFTYRHSFEIKENGKNDCFSTGVSSSDAGQIFVSDWVNQLVRVLDGETGAHVRTIKTSAVHCASGEQNGTYPDAIVVSRGRVYVGDSGRYRVHVFNELDGVFLYSFGGPEFFNVFIGIAVSDLTGDIYIVDGEHLCRVLVFNEHGEFMRVLHTAKTLGGVCVSAAGDVYVCDSEHNQILVFNSSGAHVRTICKARDPDDGGVRNHLTDVAVTRDGRLFVLDRGCDVIHMFN